MSEIPVGPTVAADSANVATKAVHSQPTCQTCGTSEETQLTSSSNFVYAIGRLEPRFPTLGVEKELAQALGTAATANLTDHEATHVVLSRPEHFYLVRQLCWILTIESTDAYVIVPRDSEDMRMLLGALRPRPRPGDIDVAVGWLGPFSDGRACNGVRLPTVNLAQLYSFDLNGFIEHLSRPREGSEPASEATVEEVMQRAGQLADNMGLHDDHRALNYLVTRDRSLYAEVARYYAKNYSLAAVRVQVSALSGPRKVMDVVLEFRNRETDAVEKRFAKVDVSEVFPFKVSKWGPYTDC